MHSCRSRHVSVWIFLLIFLLIVPNNHHVHGNPLPHPSDIGALDMLQDWSSSMDVQSRLYRRAQKASTPTTPRNPDNVETLKLLKAWTGAYEYKRDHPGVANTLVICFIFVSSFLISYLVGYEAVLVKRVKEGDFSSLQKASRPRQRHTTVIYDQLNIDTFSRSQKPKTQSRDIVSMYLPSEDGRSLRRAPSQMSSRSRPASSVPTPNVSSTNEFSTNVQVQDVQEVPWKRASRNSQIIHDSVPKITIPPLEEIPPCDSLPEPSPPTLPAMPQAPPIATRRGSLGRQPPRRSSSAVSPPPSPRIHSPVIVSPMRTHQVQR